MRRKIDFRYNKRSWTASILHQSSGFTSKLFESYKKYLNQLAD